MTFHISHRYGEDEPDPRLTAFRALLREIREDPPADAHDAVAVTHESGWALCVSRDGHVQLQNFEHVDAAPRHLAALSDDAIVCLFTDLAEGRLDEVMARPWLSGPGPAGMTGSDCGRLHRSRGRCAGPRRR